MIFIPVLDFSGGQACNLDCLECFFCADRRIGAALGDRNSSQRLGDSGLRSLIMTAFMATLGLIPAALSTGVGSEAAKPFAVVIIGCPVTSMLLTLIIFPSVYGYFERRFVKS